ncbi:MAG: HDOD domain-containing protein [Deltaproteobacteria bacterium]|jgi:HD-like signal output (HDOD) protein|nr:HDOD domain-containing protein [Deltaproteobacteria bacterium]
MSTRIKEAHAFITGLADNPPKLPYDPTLLPRLFKDLSPGSLKSMGDLAALVERSQGLATKVLSVANSACYGLAGKVSSLARAVQILGLLELRSLVVFFSVSGALPGSKLPRAFPSKALWEHQIRTAIVGRQIAAIINEARQPVVDADIIYTAGLLHDLGKVVLAAREPVVWTEISALSVERNCDFASAEESYWGIDHSAVAGILLEAWGLPEILTQMISWHHCPELANKYIPEVCVLASANCLAEHGHVDAVPDRVRELLPENAQRLENKLSLLQAAAQSSRADSLASFAL